MTRITIPFLDANIVDVTITAWHRQPGDQVVSGEIIAEVTTDKAAFELEAPASGTLLKILADTKSVVPISYTIGVIGQPEESDATVEHDNAALMEAYRAGTATAPLTASAGEPMSAAGGGVTPPTAAATAASRIRATPKARRQAQTAGIDLAAVAEATNVTLITEAILADYLKEHDQQ